MKCLKLVLLVVSIACGAIPSAYAKQTWHCKAEQMLVVRADMSVKEKDFIYEFLIDVSQNEFTLRYKTGHEINRSITEHTSYGFVSHYTAIGDYYSFFLSGKQGGPTLFHSHSEHPF